MKKCRAERLRRCLLMWLLVAPPLAAAADAVEAPSLELLEFLGNWETDDGKWQDPLEFMQELAAQEAVAKEAAAKK